MLKGTPAFVGANVRVIKIESTISIKYHFSGAIQPGTSKTALAPFAVLRAAAVTARLVSFRLFNHHHSRHHQLTSLRTSLKIDRRKLENEEKSPCNDAARFTGLLTPYTGHRTGFEVTPKYEAGHFIETIGTKSPHSSFNHQICRKLAFEILV